MSDINSNINAPTTTTTTFRPYATQEYVIQTKNEIQAQQTQVDSRQTVDITTLRHDLSQNAAADQLVKDRVEGLATEAHDYNNKVLKLESDLDALKQKIEGAGGSSGGQTSQDLSEYAKKTDLDSLASKEYVS